MSKAKSTQIECLACAGRRIVGGTSFAETGECQSCGYVGWTFSDDLEWATERMIMNGQLGRRPVAPAPERPPSRRGLATL